MKGIFNLVVDLGGLSMKIKRLHILGAARLVSVIGIFIAGLPASATFIQGFETDTVGWLGVTRVASLTRGVPSATGTHHAEDRGNDLTFTRWGSYSQTFPPLGYTTSLDIYLDISTPYMNSTGYANDTRFDWSSAINNPACAHRRDFVFNAGFYTDTDLTGSGRSEE